MTGKPTFLRRLSAVRDHSSGWSTPCPDKHTSSGFAVVISVDQRAGRYRFTCSEAGNGDLCGNEPELLRLLGLTDADVRLGGDPAGTIRADRVTMRSIDWLDKPFLQRSAFELFVGPKGCGKGTLLARIAAYFTQGVYGNNTHVIYVSSEDSMEVDSVPRLHAAAADLTCVTFVTRTIRLPDDIPWLEQLANQLGNVGLIILDPVGNHLGGVDTDKEGLVRNAVGGLNDLANQLANTIIGVRHLTKNTTNGALACSAPPPGATSHAP